MGRGSSILAKRVQEILVWGITEHEETVNLCRATSTCLIADGGCIVSLDGQFLWTCVPYLEPVRRLISGIRHFNAFQLQACLK